MKTRDLRGSVFGRWTVIEKADSRKRMVVWKCRCECGNEKEVYQKHLLSGASTSCGCFRNEQSSKRMKENNPAEIKHNMYRTRLYGIWNSMKHRCHNPNDLNYRYYGGKGIKVCEEWQEFISFMEWASTNGYDETLTLDRKDYNGNYEPTNCRWVTIQEQQYNKSNNHLITYNGKTQTLTEWAKEREIKQTTLDARINRSRWDVGRALNYG